MLYDLFCLGDLNVDLITEGLRSLPKPDKQVLSNISLSRGGSAANLAAFSRGLGLRTALCAGVSDDIFAFWLIKHMKGLGVDLFIKKILGSTGITMALNLESGKRSFITSRGVNIELRFKDIPWDIVKSSKHFNWSGFWHNEGLHKDALRIMKKAKNLKCRTSLDIGWDYKGWTKKRKHLVLALLPFVDVFFLNLSELKHLTLEKNMRKATKLLLDSGANIIALHRGKLGTTIYSKDSNFTVPSFPVLHLNPTGAGDAYNAGFIYGMLRDYSLPKIATIACANASLHIKMEKDYIPSIKNVFKLIRTV